MPRVLREEEQVRGWTKRTQLALGAAAVVALGAAGCGGEEELGDASAGGSGAQGQTFKIYSSLPLQGASQDQARAISNGMKLALKRAGYRAGDIRLEFEQLDDSTAVAGTWTPEATSANARRAAQDDRTIAYLGEFNSGASAISMPILNEAGVPQNGLTNTAVGLTTDEPGADRGEPDKYYVTGERHYVRIVPKDTIQGAALVTTMKEDGCTKAFIANDEEVFGAGLARNIELSAREQGLQIAANQGIDVQAPNFRSVAASARSAGVDCFAFSGVTANGAVQIFKDFAAALPDGKLYGPDGVAESGFADPAKGGVPPNVGDQVKVTIATLPPDEYGPEGERFFADYAEEYGDDRPDPYAIYGFEAMQLMLDAIRRAAESGEVDKAAVIDALFDTRDRKSVLGTYSIDEHGDTTLTDYGVYRIRDGQLVFDEKVKAQARR